MIMDKGLTIYTCNHDKRIKSKVKLKENGCSVFLCKECQEKLKKPEEKQEMKYDKRD